MPTHSIVLPSDALLTDRGQGKFGRATLFTGLHELSAFDAHSQHVAMLLVSSYLAFSPLLQAVQSLVHPKWVRKHVAFVQRSGSFLLR